MVSKEETKSIRKKFESVSLSIVANLITSIIESHPVASGMGIITLVASFKKKISLFKYFTTTEVVLAVSVLFFLSVYFTKLLHLLKNKYIILTHHAGVFYFRKNSTAKDKAKNEELLKKEAKLATQINIIGATGYKTFAKNDAILMNIFKNLKGEMKILLLHPFSDQAKMRASSLGVPLKEYQTEIFNSISFLKKLVDEGKSVSLKLYSQKPIWKIIQIGKTLWLQYYEPKTHVENMPVFGVERKQDKSNLFDPLHDIFLKKWDHDDNPLYNFKTQELEYPDTGSKEKLEFAF